MSDYSRPELVVAIDFGMTCMIISPRLSCMISKYPTGTGVAFCNVATGEETVRCIQKWPGRMNAVENKVSCDIEVWSAQELYPLLIYFTVLTKFEGPNCACISQEFHCPLVMGLPCRAFYRADEWWQRVQRMVQDIFGWRFASSGSQRQEQPRHMSSIGTRSREIVSPNPSSWRMNMP